MEKKNLYISDLDGTLLRNNGVLSENGRKCLLKYYNQDILFTPASARCFITMKEALGQDLKFKLPFIEFNGSYLTDYHSNEIIDIESIDNEILPTIYKDLEARNIAPIVSGNFILEKDYQKRYFCHISAIANQGLKKFKHDRYLANDYRIHLKKEMSVKGEKEKVVTLTLIDKKDKLEDFAQKIKESYSKYINSYLLEDLYNVGWHWLLVQSFKSTKAKAIQRMIKKYQLQDYKITAFGDNYNDIEMLQLADIAVCPENAIKEVKEICDVVLDKTNDEDGVFEYINFVEKINV